LMCSRINESDAANGYLRWRLHLRNRSHLQYQPISECDRLAGSAAFPFFVSGCDFVVCLRRSVLDATHNPRESSGPTSWRDMGCRDWSSMGGNLITPHQLGARIGVVAAIFAAILTALAGARGAVVTRRPGTGARIGF
jgi:hypothetical protein